MKTSSSKKTYTYAVGRRKEASARVRLFKGVGENTINGLKVADVYKDRVSEILINKPFELTETLGKYYFTAKVKGGGKVSQLEATIHGVSRSLAKLSPEKFRELLKRAKLLTRDSRSRLRRMVGTGGKARRKKQSPKR